MTCGIYMWVNKYNHHKYIGYSNNIERRWREHSTIPFKDTKHNNDSSAFYNAIRKYGVNGFDKIILEECSEEELKEKEQYYIALYNTFLSPQDYNETPGGDGISPNATLRGEQHSHVLTEQEVIFCREQYALGKRSRDVWKQFFSNKITYNGFLNMWHGRSWKHVMPEVFNHNPHRAHYTVQDRDIITQRFLDSGLNRHQFAISDDCYVGEATLYNMLDNPTFYDNK